MDAEGFVDVPGGRVWWGSVGDGEIPLLCLHGGPGFTHFYLEPLKDLANERRVVFYDQLGCGKSDRPSDPSLWTLQRHVDELIAVWEALGLTRCHLFGSSWGGMLAMQYLIDYHPDHIVSLTLAGSPASVPLYLKGAEELVLELPTEVIGVIRSHEASGYTDCPEYQAALLPFYRRHLCRLDPWPDSLERSLAAAGHEVYATMCGPSEFTVIGVLKDWDVMDRLWEITVPTLVTGGRYDHCRPNHLEQIHDRIPASELVILEDASHLCFTEQRVEYMRILGNFLDRVENEVSARGQKDLA